MGSKASRLIGASSTRKYPTRTPQVLESPSYQPQDLAQASYNKTQDILRDAQDPDYQSMLKRVGVAEILDPARNVAVNEKSDGRGELQSSNSLHTISRRQVLYDLQQMESSSKQGRDRRTWVDTSTIFEILKLRDEKKWEAGRIEKELGLAPGLVDRLGGKVGKP
ncbi:hypothetical protein L873DRAFT_1791097 [Choiromyces venosus 120613-1]|uniref:Helix-turn-helix domain-containing protein n=1 Tax=Choiromyces venosus 120613-1 TaxID=1336337 RepID=A0A3N4JG17_9PEZI|nr:hypothetical protein L873DRAFT_1791097 [Choiromyces venosus 120613-1]